MENLQLQLTVPGGNTAVPLCIHVNAAHNNEKLWIIATNAKGGNTRNVLELYDFDEGKLKLTKYLKLSAL